MPDVNILIYAHRTDEKHHRFYREWFEKLVAGPQPFALSSLVAVAFVRIVTHSRFAKNPTPLDQALAVIDSIRATSTCRLLAPGERHWPLTADLCRQSRAIGKHVGDAQHAAMAIEHGCEWITRDNDFSIFAPAGLTWQPLEP